ncbi:MAG: crossover junction endodeoxyribonuclease RuvC [Symbiobacterium thermophilum]|uniref:Crossover junction endodeoxyribonuclease RuvC n=1 Tax=Symbiobacterium thermophilum TaxID=2734 RepID=A0A1Y2T3L6_SYMTR|nr:MAG: crossover junction endodeoxyribonuclease RuvC [Symbiobacterium thermophilum]PZN73818.1 MAG: crossover junction endodeoxyribonuclease RuvC [Bacillota bacterium]
MRILGIDPGTARMGYGIVEDAGAGRERAVAYGCLETPPDMRTELRLQALYRGVIDLMARYRPDALAVEELFFGRNVTTAIHVGQARGIVLLAAAERLVPVREFTPMQVKMAVTGYGRAGKAQVQRMVQTLLGLPEPPRPDDVADALAVALAGLHSESLTARLGGPF